ncbi:ArpU family phage packaging/lysis transcriptional regulator [Limosilactobacillus reuteri]|uniref:ArpU family phage packaging/lysis transcriptional regulator n=1 Tax=Limosilactobacillus reuteri TaxID=1598 RepID=UPI0010948584|nr:ArpU family phage packaging/lysis transcriptional regulator [Limosilactobacillus reuteri]TGY64019.1 hypothetical protein E5337_03295 [Limosilactobacillus reuteri]
MKTSKKYSKEQLNTVYHNVDNFLKDDYPTIYRKSSEWFITSPSLDGMPKAPVQTNKNEDRFISHSIYDMANKVIHAAIGGCSEESKVIIQGRYFDKLKQQHIQMKLNVSGNSPYYRKLKRACLEYAECLATISKYYHIDKSIIPDLRIKEDAKV